MDFLNDISIGIQNMNSLNISSSDISKDTLAKKCVAIVVWFSLLSNHDGVNIFGVPPVLF